MTGAHRPSRRQHAIGVTLAIVVAILWVLSSELVQIVLGDPTLKYKKPYFVTYVSVSAFVFVLLGFVRPSWRAALHSPPASTAGEQSYLQLESELLSPPASTPGTACSVSLNDSIGSSNPATVEPFEVEDPESEEGQIPAYNAKQVFAIALVIAPFFFLSDWTYTVGLAMTSVASSSTISTLTALFTLVIGACMKVERFSFVKLFAAFATIGGVAVISSYDSKLQEHGQRNLMGDLINILSAFIYALYTTILKYKSGPPGALDVAMLFSFIGVATVFGAVPGLFLLNLTGWEKFELPSVKVAWMLFGNALIGTVLSDFLWAKSIVLTTPMIGTLALSLTVPLSVIIDYFFRGVSFSLPYLVGVTMVLFGFVIVNVDELRERR